MLRRCDSFKHYPLQCTGPLNQIWPITARRCYRIKKDITLKVVFVLRPLDPSTRRARIRTTYLMSPWCVSMTQNCHIRTYPTNHGQTAPNLPFRWLDNKNASSRKVRERELKWYDHVAVKFGSKFF